MPQPPIDPHISNKQRPVTQSVLLGRWFTGVRRDGFLALLDPRHWHTLCAILSFTSQDGTRRFTADQLAAALGQPREDALRWLDSLSQTQWKGEPLIVPGRDASGELIGAALAPIERLALVSPPVGDQADSSMQASPPELLRELEGVGLNHAQIDSLAKRFSEAEIRRQLRWLPARAARNPAALLIRAIEQDWDEPKEPV